jgi:putative protein-disulfide isomerase
MTDETAEEVDLLAPGTVVALIDPLCAWCWGAAPALTRLAAAGMPLRLIATGLFIGEREVTAEFADYAWTNDRRIARLTGQTFGDAYREKVLGAIGSKFDSGPATLALTAVQLRAPNRDLDVLHALQAARWVDGRDVTAPEVVAEVLRETGIDADTVAAFLAEDQAVIDTLNERAAFARDLMSHLHIRGVPSLIKVISGGVAPIDGRELFENAAAIVATVEAAGRPN